jgi:hypothetical protein
MRQRETLPEVLTLGNRRLPKGTDLVTHTAEGLQAIQRRLTRRFREIVSYGMPWAHSSCELCWPS